MLHIAASGWDHPAWNGRFYPEDLPPEWRLTYYANEIDAVLLPQRLWSAADAALERCVAETVSGFCFYLEWDGSLPTARLQQALAALGERCAGVVAADMGAARTVPVGVPVGVSGATAECPPSAGAIGCCWQQGGRLQCSGDGLRVWRWRGAAQPRQLRDLIEVLGSGSGGLLVFDDATPEQLETARTIANLLGL